MVPPKWMDGWLGLGVWGHGVEEVLNKSNTYILIKRCLFLFVWIFCLSLFVFLESIVSWWFTSFDISLSIFFFM